MILKNNVVTRLLTDEKFWSELLISQAETDGVDLVNSIDLDKDLDKYHSLYALLNIKDNKNYYITKSVIDKLSLLDTKKCMQVEGWKVFKHLPNFKKTFILPEPEKSYAKYGGSDVLRVANDNGVLQFCHITAKFLPPNERTKTTDTSLYWVLLYVDLNKDAICTHFYSEDGKSLAPFLYSLLCFVELCENEIHIIEPTAKYGTQKSGKVINTLPFPITVVNNNWNITTIRSEGFPVIGHAQIYWTGPGRSIAKLIFKEPFTKEGYTKIAGKLLQLPTNLK